MTDVASIKAGLAGDSPPGCRSGRRCAPPPEGSAGAFNRPASRVSNSVRVR